MKPTMKSQLVAWIVVVALLCTTLSHSVAADDSQTTNEDVAVQADSVSAVAAAESLIESDAELHRGGARVMKKANKTEKLIARLLKDSRQRLVSRKARVTPRRSDARTTLNNVIRKYRVQKYVRGIKFSARTTVSVLSSKLRKQISRKFRSFLRRKFSGSKKRLVSFLRRKFRGNRRAQKKWVRRTFGRRFNMRKALRRVNVRKPARRVNKATRKPARRVNKATRMLRSFIRRKFSGSKKRLVSFLRRKFRGNRRAQKKWVRRTFGRRFNMRKALRRVNVRTVGPRLRILIKRSSKSRSPRSCTRSEISKMKGPKPRKCFVVFNVRRPAGRSVSPGVGPKIRIVIKRRSKRTPASQSFRTCTKSEINKMKGPKPRKCFVAFDLEQALEIAQDSNVASEDLDLVQESQEGDEEDLEQDESEQEDESEEEDDSEDLEGDDSEDEDEDLEQDNESEDDVEESEDEDEDLEQDESEQEDEPEEEDDSEDLEDDDSEDEDEDLEQDNESEDDVEESEDEDEDLE